MAMLLIVFIVLMSIGLAFKRDIEICPLCITVLQQSHQPFHKIPYKEPYKQQFTLLQGMYVFVAPFRRGKTLLGKYYTTEIDGIKVLAKGEYGVEKYYFF